MSSNNYTWAEGPETGPTFDVGTSSLLCPACGDGYTHVDVVTFASAGGTQRTLQSSGGEDEYAGVEIGQVHRLPGVIDVGRRHSIGLLLDCEACDNPSWFVLKQHKGVTLYETWIGSKRTDGHGQGAS